MEYQSLIQQSIDYIEDNLQGEISAEELAQKAGFSLFHYYRVFQSFVGMPVMQFVLQRRLLNAIYEIRGGRSKTDAALAYGFDTYAGFYKAFRREFGCQPSVYIQSGRARKPWRWNLEKEKHMEITRKRAKKWLENWNLQTEMISDIFYEATGNKNQNALYVGKEYVLKYTENLGKLKNNLLIAKAMEENGLSASTAVKALNEKEYLQDGPIYYYLAKRVSGKPLNSKTMMGEDSAEKGYLTGKMIGRLHLALQNIDLPLHQADLLEQVENWALPRTKEILLLDNSFCRNFAANLRKYYPLLPRQLIHRDPNPSNIIQDHERWGVVDFELSENNVRIFDPIYASTAVLSETFTDWNCEKGRKWVELYRSIMSGYDGVLKLTEDEKMAVPYVLLANQAICVAWFSEQDKYPEAFEANKNMTKWLIDHFEQLAL